MQQNPDFSDLFSALNGANARYLVIGGYAFAYHAEPRYTKDLDIWVEPTSTNAEAVWQALASFGAPLSDLEVVDLATPGMVVQIGVAPNRIDIVTSIEAVIFTDAWGRRADTVYGNVPIHVIGMEDLIRNKRAVGRPQDLVDIKRLTRKH